jgi:predicted O-methyltransferase YrrM
MSIYKGVALSKKEIEDLCNYSCNKTVYTNYSEMLYSQGKLLKEYLFYPKYWDLYVTLEHGVGLLDDIENGDILQETDVMFTVNKKNPSPYKKIFTMGAMFKYYRGKNKINKRKDAIGTVVFPMHSSQDIGAYVEWKEYIKKLNELPKEFKPFLICLHYEDVKRGLHKIFYENGFYVTSAGHGYDDKFVERFYNIISSCKYSTSNYIMSSTFYAVELGLPFFLYGYQKSYKLKKYGQNFDVDFTVEEVDLNYKNRNQAVNLFSNISTEISNEQKIFVEEKLGTYDKNNRIFLAFILYKEFIKYQYIFLKRKIYKKYLSLMYKKYFLKESLNITNHMELEEKLLLIKFAKKIKKGIIVEIGSFLGSNTINLAKNSPNSKIFAIDNWSRHMVDNCKDRFKKNISKFNNIVVLDGKFEEIYKNFKEQIDLLIIDGEHHSYEVIKRDLMLFNNLKKNGIIIIHHYKWASFVKMNIIDNLQDKTKKIVVLENIWVGKKNV